MFMIFWFICAVLFGGAWLVSALVWVLGLWRKSTTLKMLGGLPLAGLSGLGVLFVGMIAWNYLFPPSPAQLFEQTFGFAPTADVTELRGKDSSFGDYGEIYLSFKAAPSTIKRIANGRFKKSKQAQQSYTDPPEWWNPPLSDDTVSYLPIRKPGWFSDEDEVLHYETINHQAYYEYTGVD